MCIRDRFRTISGTDFMVYYEDERIGDIKHSRLSNVKAERDFGFTATTTLEDGLQKTLEYFKADVYKRQVGGYRYLEDGGKTKDITGQNMTYRTSDRHFEADQAMGWSDPYYVTVSYTHLDVYKRQYLSMPSICRQRWIRAW